MTSEKTVQPARPMPRRLDKILFPCSEHKRNLSVHALDIDQMGVVGRLLSFHQPFPLRHGPSIADDRSVGNETPRTPISSPVRLGILFASSSAVRRSLNTAVSATSSSATASNNASAAAFPFVFSSHLWVHPCLLDKASDAGLI